MTTIKIETTNKSISHIMQNLLDKIKSSVLHTRELYEEFVETARLEGFSDYEIDLLLKENLKGIVPERTLSYYRNEYLQLEDKNQKKKNNIEHSSGRSRQIAGIEDKKVIEISSYPPNPELEQFRKEKGRIITSQKMNDTEDVYVRKNDQLQEEQEIIYENPQKIIKQYEERITELEQKYDKAIMPYKVKEIIIALNGQELPIIIEVDPHMRTAKPELDRTEIKKLMRF